MRREVVVGTAPGAACGQVAVEFALLCALLAAALLWPWGGGEPVALAWLRAWSVFLDSAGFWLADG